MTSMKPVSCTNHGVCICSEHLRAMGSRVSHVPVPTTPTAPRHHGVSGCRGAPERPCLPPEPAAPRNLQREVKAEQEFHSARKPLAKRLRNSGTRTNFPWHWRSRERLSCFLFLKTTARGIYAEHTLQDKALVSFSLFRVQS